MCKTLTVLVLALISVRVFAISDDFDAYFQQLSGDELTNHVYVAAAVIASLVLCLITLFILKTKSQRTLKTQLAQTDHEIKQLPTGILHLSLSGKVQFLNESAARLLGRNQDKLLGTSLKEHFCEKHQELVDQAMTDKASKTLIVEARVSNLFLGLMFGEVVSNNGHPYMVVTLVNQDANNRELQSLSMQVNRTSEVLGAVGFYTARIYAADQLWSPEHKLSQLLGLEHSNQESKGSSPTSFERFVSLVHKNDLNIWDTALEQASENGSASVFLRVSPEAKGLAGVVYLPLEIHISADNTNAKPVEDEDEAENASSKTTHNNFTMLVRQNNINEQHIASLSVLQSQQHALSTASDNAAYMLDEDGNVLWANAQFNELLNKLLPDEKSLNFLELSPFPDEVMQLHIDPPYNSDSCESITFELASDSVRPTHYRLELSVYVERGRLDSVNQKGVVAVLHDITDMVVLDKDYKQEKLRVLELNEELMNEQTSLIAVGSELKSIKEEFSQQKQAYDQTMQALEDTDAQLETANASLRLMQENSPVAIAIIDEKDRIVSANRVMQERLKYSEKEITKGNLYKLFSNPTDAGVAAKIKNTEGALSDFHVLLQGNDGNIYPGEMTIRQLDSESGQSMVWIVDRSDEQFQRDKFDSILSHGAMPLALLENNGFSKINEKACQIFGTNDEEELLGLAPYSTQFNVDQNQAETLEEHIQDVKKSRKAKTLLWSHKINGIEYVLESTFVPMYKDQEFDSILCMWENKSEVQQSSLALQDALRALSDSRNNISEQHQLIQGYEAYVSDLNESVKVNEDKLHELESQLERANAEQSATQEKCDLHIQALTAAQNELENSFSEIKALNENNTDLVDKLSNAEKEIKGLTELRIALNEGLNESRSKLEQVEQKLALNQKSFDEVSSQSPKMTEQIASLQERLSTVSQESESKSDEIQVLNSELEALTRLHSQEDEKINTLVNQLEENQNHQQQLDAKNAELSQQVDELIEKLEQKTSELRHLEIQMQQLQLQQASTGEMSENLDQKSEELKQLQAELLQLESERELEREAVGELTEKLDHTRFELANVEEELKRLQAEQFQTDEASNTQVQSENANSNVLHMNLPVRDSEESVHQAETHPQSSALVQPDWEVEERPDDGEKEREQEVELTLEDAELSIEAIDTESKTESSEELESNTLEARLPELYATHLYESAELWFNLNSYSNNNPNSHFTISDLRNDLVDFDASISLLEASIHDEDLEQLKASVSSLAALANKTKSEPLINLISGIKSDSANGMLDNVSIRWPAAKQGLYKTMRVMLSHIDAE